MGSKAARLYNDYRCRLNGDTTILRNASASGELYPAGPVTCNQALKVLEDATARPTETGHVFCCQNGGSLVGTDIAYPIRFSARRFAACAVNPIGIYGTGTRDVEINAPLQVNGASTTFNDDVAINGALVVGTTNVTNAIHNEEHSFVLVHL